MPSAREVAQAAASDERLLHRYFQQVFQTDAGEIVLEYLRAACFAREPSFRSDPSLTAYNEGKRAVLLTIEAFLQPWTEPPPSPDPSV